jgi:hypothetical protein
VSAARAKWIMAGLASNVGSQNWLGALELDQLRLS